MTTVARRIAATPIRTTTETWSVIVNLLAANDDDLRRHLDRVGNIAAMLIGEEHTKTDPVIVTGGGPQVRIYTLHGDAAIDDTNINEQYLTIDATPDWEIALPASGSDFTLAKAMVAGIDHVIVYDPSNPPAAGSASRGKPVHEVNADDLMIDLSVLEN